MECSAVDALCSFENLTAESFQQPQWIIITGGPGVGKTSLVKHYEKSGFEVIHEAATDIIRERLDQQIKEPWNQEGFNTNVIELQLKRQVQAEARKANLVFFDRSPIDVLAYSHLQQDKSHCHITRLVEEAVFRYHKKVFLIENLGACENTEVRPESIEEVRNIERLIEDHYRKYNFEIVRIPPAPIEERARLILQHLGLLSRQGNWGAAFSERG